MSNREHLINYLQYLKEIYIEAIKSNDVGKCEDIGNGFGEVSMKLMLFIYKNLPDELI